MATDLFNPPNETDTYNWTDAYWSLGVPAAGEAAAWGAAFGGTVDLSTTAEAGSLGSSGGKLDIMSGGSLTIDTGAAAVFQSTITVESGGSFALKASAGTYQVYGFSTAGTLTINSGATLETGGTLGGTIAGAGELLIQGASTLTSSVTVSSLSVQNVTTLGGDITYGGTFTASGNNAELLLNGHTLTLSGSAPTLAFNVGGGGTLKVTGTANIGDSNGDTVNLGANNTAVTLEDAGTMTQNGALGIGVSTSELLIDSGSTYTFITPPAGFNNPTINGPGPVVNNGTLIASAQYAIDDKFTNNGVLTVSAGDTLQLNSNASGGFTLGGTINGAGTLYLGGPTTISSTSITVSALHIAGNNSDTTLGANISYGGAFTQDQNGFVNLNGDTLTLSGAATLSSNVGGPGKMKITGAATVNGANFFSNAQTATLEDAGAMTQTGSSSLGSELLIDAGATYTVQGAGTALSADNNSAAVVIAGGDLIFQTGSSEHVPISFTNAGGTLQLFSQSSAVGVGGSNGVVDLTDSQTSVTGGNDTIAFVGGSGNVASLQSTGGHFDAVNGSNGSTYLNAAQAWVSGGGDTVYFASGSGNVAELYSTNNNWDRVNGSNGSIYLNGAQAYISGGGDTIYFEGSSGNTAELFSTNNSFDTVSASNGQIYMNGTQAWISGGGDTIYFEGNSGNVAELYGTNGNFDTVNASNGSIYMNGTQAWISGGGDTIYFEGNSGNVAELYSTNNHFDSVSGSNGQIYLNDTQAWITGGGDAIFLEGSSGNVAELYGTNGASDGVYGSSGAIYLNSAQATVVGNSDTVSFYGTGNALTASGSSEALVFQAAIGQDVISGFNSSDAMTFSASDFANFQAVQQHMTQSGANTVITLDANDTVTLTGVTAANLTASQFHFV